MELVGEEEELEAVAEEAESGANGEDQPEGEMVGCDAGEEAEKLAGVRGECEVVELQLGDGKLLLELRGVGGEVEVGAIDGLKPDDGHKAEPLESSGRHWPLQRLRFLCSANRAKTGEFNFFGFLLEK